MKLRAKDFSVTVVIPTIPGREERLKEALESVYAQTLSPNDVVVYNDVQRRGAWYARNSALLSVKTSFVAYLDDDDKFLPDHLETLIGTAKLRTDADMVYSYMEIMGYSRDPLACPVNGKLVLPLGVPFGKEQEFHLRFVGNFIPVTYLVKTNYCRLVGGMPEPYSAEWPRCCEDWGFLIRLLDAGAKFVHIPRRTWIYNVHSDNTGGGFAGPDTLISDM